MGRMLSGSRNISPSSIGSDRLVGRHEQDTGAAHAEPFGALVVEAHDHDACPAACRDQNALAATGSHVPRVIAGGEPRPEADE